MEDAPEPPPSEAEIHATHQWIVQMTITSGLTSAGLVTAAWLFGVVSLVVAVVVAAALLAVGAYIIRDARRGRDRELARLRAQSTKFRASGAEFRRN